jgi:hypothetical protein
MKTLIIKTFNSNNVVIPNPQTSLLVVHNSSGNLVHPPNFTFQPTCFKKPSLTASTPTSSRRTNNYNNLNPNCFSSYDMSVAPSSDDRVARITKAIRVIPDFPKPGMQNIFHQLFFLWDKVSWQTVDGLYFVYRDIVSGYNNVVAWSGGV